MAAQIGGASQLYSGVAFKSHWIFRDGELNQGMGINREEEGLESSPISYEVNIGIQQFGASEEKSTRVNIYSLTDAKYI